MDLEENLRRVKAEYDREVDAILTDPQCDEAEFLRRTLRCCRAASSYTEALVRAAPQVRPELGEAYRASAGEVSARVSHFLSFITEHRQRLAQS